MLLDRLDPSVMVIDLFPGLAQATLNHLLNTPGIKGVVLRTYGAGNTPTYRWFIDAIRQAVDRGLIILNVTQCVNGTVRINRYVSGDILASIGVISGYDITVEAALTKMMSLFGRGISDTELRQALTEPIAGEMTVLG